MRNLIRNSNWKEFGEAGPAFFRSKGFKYVPSPQGGRFCTLSQPAGSGREVHHTYEIPLPVRGRRAVRLGYIIRAQKADSIDLWADFLDSSDRLVESARRDITERVTTRYTRHSARFPVPRGARTVQLSLRFAGEIKDCTFFSPFAYYC